VKIENYQFGCITIDQQEYQSDVLILGGRVQDGWWRKEGHRLHVSDLDDVLKGSPAILIVGTGFYGRMRVPAETQAYLREMGITLHIAETGEAVHLYNDMMETADLVADLHLTC